MFFFSKEFTVKVDVGNASSSHLFGVYGDVISSSLGQVFGFVVMFPLPPGFAKHGERHKRHMAQRHRIGTPCQNKCQNTCLTNSHRTNVRIIYIYIYRILYIKHMSEHMTSARVYDQAIVRTHA